MKIKNKILNEQEHPAFDRMTKLTVIEELLKYLEADELDSIGDSIRDEATPIQMAYNQDYDFFKDGLLGVKGKISDRFEFLTEKYSTKAEQIMNLVEDLEDLKKMIVNELQRQHAILSDEEEDISTRMV